MNKIISYFTNRIHILLYLVCAIALVFLFNRFVFRWDLTNTKIFTLSKVSKNLVSDLKDPLRIKVFISKNLPPPLNDLRTTIQDLFDEYQEVGNNNFSYTIYDVTEAEGENNTKVAANIKLANDYGINARQVQTLQKDKMQLIKVYSGVIIEYGNLIERIPFITETANLEYQITTIFDKMNKKLNRLLSLEEKITAKLYLPDDFVKVAPFFNIEGLGTIKEKMEDIFIKVGEQNYNKVDFEVVSKLDPQAENLLAGSGVRFYPWGSFTAPGKKSFPAGKGVAGLVISYKDKVEVVELLAPQTTLQLGEGGLEQVVQYVLVNLENYETVVDGIIDNIINVNDFIAYVQDKGSVKTEQSTRSNPFLQGQNQGEGANFINLLSQNYNVEKINLEDLTTKYKTLVLAGAREKFSDYDLFLIDQFLMQGRSLIIFQDSLENKDANNPLAQTGREIPKWGPITNHLDLLLEHYGVKVKPTYVMDKNSYISRNRTADGGISEQQIYFAPLIQDENINHSFIPLGNIRTFVGLEMSPLEQIETKLKSQEIKVTSLFSSSDESWQQEKNISLIPQFIKPPTTLGEYKKSDLAYLLEGNFKSYFSGKPVPEKFKTKGNNEKNSNKKASPIKQFANNQIIIEKSKPAKIIVVGSSSMIKNNLIDEKGISINSVLILNLIDYLSDREDWAVMRSKGQRVNPLEVYNEKAPLLIKWLTNRQAIKWLNMLGLPILVAIIGLLVYFMRNSRRRKLAKIFDFNDAK